MGKLIVQVCGAFAEFERAMIAQRIHAELTRGKKAGKTLGRPKLDPAVDAAIRKPVKEGGKGVHTIAAAQRDRSAHQSGDGRGLAGALGGWNSW
jgi:DNA invertase Pin-like site-specific DNA recombinase